MTDATNAIATSAHCRNLLHRAVAAESMACSTAEHSTATQGTPDSPPAHHARAVRLPQALTTKASAAVTTKEVAEDQHATYGPCVIMSVRLRARRPGQNEARERKAGSDEANELAAAS